MRSNLSFVVLLSLLACQTGQAQALNENDFTCYTRVQGLSNNYVTGIVQDSTGYLWVATNKGLNRFDGRFFSNYYLGTADLSLPDNMIKSLHLQGNEIIGSTAAGAFHYNTYTGKSKKLIIPSDSLIFGWTNYIQETIRDEKGRYILSSRTGLYVMDSLGSVVLRFDYFTKADARQKEMYFATDLFPLQNGLILQNNDLFFSAYDPSANRIDTLFGQQHILFKKALTDSHNGIRVTFPGPANQVFIVNAETNSFDVFDFDENKIYPFPLPFEVERNIDPNLSSLIFLNDSLVALTGKTSGFYLFRYQPKTHRLSLQGEKYFDGIHCSSVFIDREGRYWVGTSNGLYKQNLTNPMYHDYDVAGRLPDLRNCELRVIFTSRDRIFLGFKNQGGLLMQNKFSHQLERRFDFGKLGARCNTIQQIFPFSADTLWIGTANGYLWLNTSNYRFGRLHIPHELQWMNEYNPLCITEDRFNNVWMGFGRANSVVRYNRNTRTFTDISGPKNPLLRITFCFSMEQDLQGNMWFAGDGLCRWSAAKQKIDTLILYPSAARSRNTYIYILGIDSLNSLWLTSLNNGIIEYKIPQNKMYLRKEENNFWDSDVITSSPVIRGHIWLGVDNGVSVFNIHDYSWSLYSYGDGLPSLAINSLRRGSWYDAGENVFYLGSGNHLISFTADLSFSVQSSPTLFIDAINTAAGSFRGNIEKLELNASEHVVQIDFNAVNFRSPEDNLFAYRVLPSRDSSWQSLSWQHRVNFNNPAPGKYRIQLKLFSANNRWPEQTRDLILIVHPPFWKTAGFIALLIALLLLAAVLLYRYRSRSLRQKLSLDQQLVEYEMKALHAQMNPHFIFNALNSIKEMILHQETKQASLYLSRFAQLIRMNLEHSRKVFISLRQNIEYLERYLEMEQLRFADFSFTITVENGLDEDEVRIAPMMIQPLVENAIWHGLLPSKREKRLRISFSHDKEQLICEIEDNGIGIAKSMEMKSESQQLHASLGIANIRQRIAILNEKYKIDCSLVIKDHSDISPAGESGTTATLVVPLKKQHSTSNEYP
jgi:ligand-binding sensor domain-containing protein/two-component sensor histidine kinase